MKHGLTAGVIIALFALGGCNNHFHELIPPDENEILSFSVPEQAKPAAIARNSISFLVEKGNDMRLFIPQITVSDRASLIPLTLEYIQAAFPSENVFTRASEMYTRDDFADHLFELIREDRGFNIPELTIPIDFSEAVDFLVISAKGSIRRYTVNVGNWTVIITGLGAEDKVYDGTTTATITGTPIIEGLMPGDDITVNYGTASFENAAAGNNKTVTLSGLSLVGADAGSYTVVQPTIKANITPKELTVTVGPPFRTLIPFDSADEDEDYGTTDNFYITVRGIVGSDIVSVDLASNSYGITRTAGGIVTAATTRSACTLTYDGTTTVSQTSVSIGLTSDDGNYTLSGATVPVVVIDGQADTRAIPVTTLNITAFNIYANTADGLTRHYKLMTSITLRGTNNWTAIGTAIALFTGSFDGQSRTITGLNINTAADYQGFFGVTHGRVVNLGLRDVIIFGGGSVGGVAGYNSGTVQGCFTSGGTVTSTSEGGGVVGCNQGGTVQNCYSTCNVVGSSIHIGGVTGYNLDGGIVQSCYATGNVDGSSCVGGVTGRNNGGIVQYCYKSGNAVRASDHAGGVVGVNEWSGTVQSCFSTCSIVSTNKYSGGVAGGNWEGSLIQNCYATGNVTSAEDFSGGITGVNSKSTVRNCYATGAVTNQGEHGYWAAGVGSSSSRIQNCVALNPSVKVRVIYKDPTIPARISTDDQGNAILDNNYAYDQMVVQDATRVGGRNKTLVKGLNAIDGADVSIYEVTTFSWWTTPGRWSTAAGGEAWDFISVWRRPPSDHYLPSLRNMPDGWEYHIPWVDF